MAISLLSDTLYFKKTTALIFVSTCSPVFRMLISYENLIYKIRYLYLFSLSEKLDFLTTVTVKIILHKLILKITVEPLSRP